MAHNQQLADEQAKMTESAEVLVGISDKGWTPWQLVIGGVPVDAFITARNANANQIMFAVSEYVVAMEGLKAEKLFIPNPTPRPVYSKGSGSGGNFDRKKATLVATPPKWVNMVEGETVYKLGYIKPLLSDQMKASGIGESKTIPFAYFDVDGGYIATDRLGSQSGATKFPASTMEFISAWDRVFSKHEFKRYSRAMSEWLNNPTADTAAALEALELVCKEQALYVVTKKSGENGKYTNIVRVVIDPALDSLDAF